MATKQIRCYCPRYYKEKHFEHPCSISFIETPATKKAAAKLILEIQKGCPFNKKHKGRPAFVKSKDSD